MSLYIGQNKDIKCCHGNKTYFTLKLNYETSPQYYYKIDLIKYLTCKQTWDIDCTRSLFKICNFNFLLSNILLNIGNQIF